MHLFKKIFENNKDEIPQELKTANEFINIKDIQGNFLYTNSGEIIVYVKVFAKNTKLMNKEEQSEHAKRLTSEFVSENKPLKYILQIDLLIQQKI